jgi:allophanate hydrolase subunit 2
VTPGDVIAVVEAVGIATVQDGGRHGHASVGVPVSGALHRLRYRTATALLAGRVDDRMPAVEILAGDLGLRVGHDTALGVVGPARVTIDGRATANGTVVLARAGSRVRVTVDGPGPAYAVIDGWQAPSTLGSAATDTFSRLGPAPLRAGDRLPGRRPTASDRIGVFHRRRLEEGGPIRVVACGDPGLADFVARRWAVASTARSGVRLGGGPPHAVGSIPSMPMVIGAIQLTPSGEAIVLGPDGGLTGGYPVVAVVASVDLDRLSLLRSGDTVAFRSVDVDEAARAHAAASLAEERALAHPAHLP